MRGIAKTILKAVEKEGEITLAKALSLASPKLSGHRRQYPLALLLQEGYVGATVHDDPSNGTDHSPEFHNARFLHMLTLPKNENGETRYLGIRATGSIDPDKDLVFISAKGMLYLEEQSSKVKERVYSFVVAVAVGILVAAVSTWFIGKPACPNQASHGDAFSIAASPSFQSRAC
ncbi:hypothetical protein [Marinobacter sp. BGYM27]|uniref:hypothetical protein n=1 Tax=Marinobacter sp. BGYM27 TaxID=2975597 RepID=UPI0021A37EB7|nr:hypothetical protein [Marinobacter sp. BGYM27]MDG5501275.1 hypothetical protein [Marinobacter sp. BGYM27]